MTLSTVFVESAAFWAPTLPGWEQARAAFRGEAIGTQAITRRPAPALLPEAERRRASDCVALALEVAAAAVAASGQRADALPSVFTSCHGDLAITDAMCTTLASSPLLVSPTRFHNSVHNAASGYWGIATGCRETSTAVTASESSFAAGLLEALAQVATEDRPVLLVGVDVAARGALASVTRSQGMLAVALVLSPRPSGRSLASLTAALVTGPSERIAPRSEAALALAGNAMADALPLFEALARADRHAFAMPLSALLSLRVQLGEVDAAFVRPAA